MSRTLPTLRLEMKNSEIVYSYIVKSKIKNRNKKKCQECQECRYLCLHGALLINKTAECRISFKINKSSLDRHFGSIMS